jgi:receptor expression-enhancing protein 1/2/3/4
MFDLLAKLLCSVATFLFPVFASYKALKANDPTQLTPWLMYWVVVACVLFVESWVDWILVWFPFYQVIRAGFMLWLVLPQSQGATKLYVEYIHPNLQQHEKEIEDFIYRTHEQAKSAFIQYVRHLIDMAKQAVFGSLPHAEQRPQTPPPPEPANYAQSLFSRWKVPPITPYAPQMAADFYHFLSTAIQQQQGTPGNLTETMASSGTLIPPDIKDANAKARFIELQRERLSMVQKALENEMKSLLQGGETTVADVIDTASENSRLAKSPSQGNMSSHDGDYENVDMDDANHPSQQPQRQQSSGWLWGWGGSKAAPAKEHTE